MSFTCVIYEQRHHPLSLGLFVNSDPCYRSLDCFLSPLLLPLLTPFAGGPLFRPGAAVPRSICCVSDEFSPGRRIVDDFVPNSSRRKISLKRPIKLRRGRIGERTRDRNYC